MQSALKSIMAVMTMVPAHMPDNGVFSGRVNQMVDMGQRVGEEMTRYRGFKKREG